MRILGTASYRTNTPLHFSDNKSRSRTVQKCAAIPYSDLLLTLNVFQRLWQVNGKRKLPPGWAHWSATSFVSPLCHATHTRILTCFPFSLRAKAHFKAEAKELGLINSLLNTVATKPWFSSKDRSLTCLIATFAKICTSIRSTLLHSNASMQTPRRPTRLFILLKQTAAYQRSGRMTSIFATIKFVW